MQNLLSIPNNTIVLPFLPQTWHTFLWDAYTGSTDKLAGRVAAHAGLPLVHARKKKSSYNKAQKQYYDSVVTARIFLQLNWLVLHLN